MTEALHIYQAKGQPAIHYIDYNTGMKCTVANPPKMLLPTACCRKKRRASNLTAHVYYDGIWFYCIEGKGCRA